MESLIVMVLVGGVAFLLARSLYRSWNGKGAGCQCGDGSCPLAGNCDQGTDSEHSGWKDILPALVFAALVGQVSLACGQDPAQTPVAGEGVTYEIAYQGEVFSNLRGGLRTADATEYRGNLDLAATFDLEKLGLWRGGGLYLYAQDGHGLGITEQPVGDLQGLSNLEAHEFTQISELWLEQSLGAGRVQLKVGKQDANADFCVVDHGEHFINSSFGLIPTVPLPTFPYPALGAAVFARPAAAWTVGIGLYDGEPETQSLGFDTAFDGRGGAFALAEVTWRPHPRGENLSVYRVGFWRHTEDCQEIEPAGDPETLAGNYGLFLTCDKVVLREGGSGQGLGVFFQLGWAPADRNELSLYLGGGLAWRGLFPGRDEDVLGLGAAHAHFSERVHENMGLPAETACELFYKYQVADRLSLQPDLQYIIHPGGGGRNALAVGMRFEVGM